MHLRRQRAERLTPVQHTHGQDNLPEIGKKIADKAHRTGVAARLADPAVPKSRAGDRTLIDHDDGVLNDLALSMLHTAQQPAAQTLYGLQTGPGIGNILSRVRLYELHAIDRVPRVQDVVSSCRFGQCAKDSAGQRYGPAGTKLGTASLTGAFSEAAVLF
jgi:hypothetical protein